MIWFYRAKFAAVKSSAGRRRAAAEVLVCLRQAGPLPIAATRTLFGTSLVTGKELAPAHPACPHG